LGSDRDWLVCTSTQAALDRLETMLPRAIEPEDPGLGEMASYMLMQEGKRLRPALVLLAGTFGKNPSDDMLMRAATAMELLHVASLYHDDVMDRAEVRRRVPSANVRWGNTLATVSGTYLFACAANLFSSFSPWANQLASEAVVKLSTGQVLEIEHAFDLDLTEPQLLDILRKKTATLFELPLRLGSFLAGAPEEQIETLAAYGREIGLAFQLTDDTLDFVGDGAAMGKQTDRDLRAGVYSLPVIRACQSADAGQQVRDLLQRFDPSDDDIATAARLIRQSGAVDATLVAAREIAQRAQTCVQQLPDGPARHSLQRLAEHVVTRTF
jgi:geranylgeranyl pyrophosphate synthase